MINWYIILADSDNHVSTTVMDSEGAGNSINITLVHCHNLPLQQYEPLLHIHTLVGSNGGWGLIMHLTASVLL